MWVSIKEYFGVVFKSWVFVLSAISLIVALIFGSYQGFEMPFWLWFAISTLVLFVVQFWAFHRVRTDRDALIPEHIGKRTGIHMKGGKGDFERTKIRKQDVSINTEDTDLKTKDTDIE
jgi:hypothetical protein